MLKKTLRFPLKPSWLVNFDQQIPLADEIIKIVLFEYLQKDRTDLFPNYIGSLT